MNLISEHQDEWQRRATAAAISGARKIVLGNQSLMMAHVGRLSDVEWGWIITAAIFAWIQTRCEQAMAEGIDPEHEVRITGSSPSPCIAAAVRSILPELADKAAIDWSQPLTAWSQDTMINFLMLARQLISAREGARKILRQSKSPDWEEGDPIPFDL